MIRRRFLTPAGLLAAGLLVAAPQLGSAQGTLNLASSAHAQCVGGSYGFATCEALRFTLSFDDPQNGTLFGGGTMEVQDIHVSRWALFNYASPMWQFAVSPLLFATPGTWTTFANSSEVRVENSESTGTSGPNVLYPPQPIVFDIRMATWQDDFIDFAMGSQAEGLAQPTAGGNRVNYSSASEVSVVPEPTTVVLLGTGLLGMLGVARRRRRRDLVE